MKPTKGCHENCLFRVPGCSRRGVIQLVSSSFKVGHLDPVVTGLFHPTSKGCFTPFLSGFGPPCLLKSDKTWKTNNKNLNCSLFLWMCLWFSCFENAVLCPGCSEVFWGDDLLSLKSRENLHTDGVHHNHLVT